MLDALVLALDLAVVALGLRRLRQTPEDWLLVGLGVGCFCAVIGMLGYPYSFRVMRMLAWGLFVACPLYALVAAALIRDRHPVGAALQGFAALLLVAVGIDAFLLEPHDLQLTRYTVVSDAVDRPIRIGLIADLQTDDPGAYESEAVRRVLAEQPDLVLWAGDYIQDHDPTAYAAKIDRLNGLLTALAPAPPLGMVAVHGNTEAPGWTAAFDGLPVHADDRTQRHALGPLTVTALSFHDGFDTQLSVDGVPGFHVVLAHGPDFALGSIDADLLLAGHTHGGQVRIPLLDWPIITYSRVPRAWAAGRTELPDGGTLIVSRGVGMERQGAPPIRLACRPEIVIIDVQPASGSVSP